MKTVAALAILAFTLAAGQTAANLTGKWSGTFTITGPDGASHADTIELNLTHKGTELTGTAGPRADRQWPLKGIVAGDKVTFQVQTDGGPTISFTLTHAKNRLTGEASGEEDGQKLSAKVDAAKAK